MTHEVLLTQQEIEVIVTKAQFSLLNNPGIVAQFPKVYIDIFHITYNKKLLFIKGNEHTGLEHIMLRHGFWNHAVNHLYKGFVETSKFDKDNDALLYYAPLAEHLYDPKHLNTNDNNNVEVFDLYSAVIQEKEYRLLLYKGTKIVHTLYPNEPIESSSRQKKKYKRGEMIFHYNGFRSDIPLLPFGKDFHLDKDYDVAVITIPYFNNRNKLCYALQFSFFKKENIEKPVLLIYEDEVFEKCIQFKEKINKEDFSLYNRINEIKYNKLNEIDDIISKVEDGSIKERGV